MSSGASCERARGGTALFGVARTLYAAYGTSLLAALLEV